MLLTRQVTYRRWLAAGVVAFLLAPWPTAATTVAPERSWPRLPVTGNRAQLPHDLTLVMDARGLAVQRGKLRAPLEIDGHSLPIKLSVAMDGKLVGIYVTDSCDVVHKLYLGLPNLEARLENVAALAQHRQRRWADSAAGFARALALDPTFDVAATNLASAQLRSGRAEDAVKTLAPFLYPPRAATYARLVADPELVPLLDRPEVAAVRASVAGTARLKVTPDDVTLDGRFAFSSKYRLVAAVRGEASWGNCAHEAELVLLDSAGGVAARMLLLSMNEETIDEARNCPIEPSARRSVAARVAAAQRLLTDLGFSPGGEPGELSLTERGMSRAKFAQAKIGLVIGAGVARALRGNREIGSAPTPGESLVAASFFDRSYVSLNAVVFEWSRAGREGCEGTDPHGIQLLPILPTN
jgi:hypothetical protein